MRVLVVDDDPLTLEPLVLRLERAGHAVVSRTDGASAWEVLQGETSFDIIVLDWMMPGMSGIELCRRIRARSDHPYTYVVMVTGRTDRKDVVAGLDAGADDYLIKPFDWDELHARLRAGERIVNLQNALIEAREALRIRAMQDPLTGILNHGAILDALSREVNRAQRDARPLSLALADLDEFKRINDRYGHVVGDQVLIEVARRMTDCLRSYDSIGRYGGEEFLFVFPNCDSRQAARLAERVRTAISGTPFEVGSLSIGVTISQGVTSWDVPRPIPVENLIRSADHALYGVKRSGRDAVRCERFDPAGTEAARGS